MSSAPEAVAERRVDWKAWVAPAAAIIILVVALSVVIALSNRSAGSDAPPEAGPFAFPEASNPTTAYDVGEVFNDRVRLDLAGGSSAPASGSSREIALAAETRWEFLQPATLDDINVGDNIQVIGVPNDVRSFHIRSVVVMAAEGATVDEDGVVRSPGGFAGHEASRDSTERPVLGGAVTEKTDTGVTIDGPTGPITITLLEGANVRTVTAQEGTNISDGDRVAFASTDGQPASVLVLPGGARE